MLQQKDSEIQALKQQVCAQHSLKVRHCCASCCAHVAAVPMIAAVRCKSRQRCIKRKSGALRGCCCWLCSYPRTDWPQPSPAKLRCRNGWSRSVPQA